jgi:hypothetical protein
VGSDAFVPDIEICLVNSAANNRNITVTCGGVGYNNNSVGFAKTGNVSCISVVGCHSLGVETGSWGHVKSLYR